MSPNVYVTSNVLTVLFSAMCISCCSFYLDFPYMIANNWQTLDHMVSLHTEFGMPFYRNSDQLNQIF
ncbi:hypothetical protein C5470_20710 [Photorhabdus stackebrandtii]|uniref:Uncharacterized protein n=1 Tax=Photorhabdus stackebrandtii TaxID=1123042 RepID=A0A7X5QQJ9_9GAMM|nr:hypothetical protein [Photorhabdus stackebrandtii]